MLNFSYAARVFPAGAGVILPDITFVVVDMSFPRRCGGDPKITDLNYTSEKFSPQVRG